MLQQVDLACLLKESYGRVTELPWKEQFLNATQLRSFHRFAQLAESRGCKAGSLNYLLLATVLSSQKDMIQRVCKGHGFMSEATLENRISPEMYDDCSPFYALPLGRIDFFHALQSHWPTFWLLQLLSERWAGAFPSIESCDLYRDSDLEPARFLSLRQSRLPGFAQGLGLKVFFW